MLRPLGRGLRDTLDNLLPFTITSLLWWLSVLLIVTAPAGTIALFRATDPANLESDRRPTRAEVGATIRAELVRGWVLALAFGIPLVALVSNLRVYGASDGWARWLVPLWIVLLVLIVCAAGLAVSLRAIHGRSAKDSIWQSVVLTLGGLPRCLPTALILWIVVAAGGVLVIPALMFVPALVAVTFNHLASDCLGIPVHDPLDPTAERRNEENRARGSRYSTN